ncbi:MAG: hypothetical protein HY746_05305, partial [Elusimicrobia bacterium]|nr:hypothetical protein [Elusimicrobiota bacterium]
MEELNKKEQKKSGLLAALSRLFKGGKPTPVSGSSLGSAGAAAVRGIFGSSGGFGGLGGLFASKAGMVGMILGGATIAAGIGVVYNFIGPSSKPVYTPGLFQDT